jgi:hypothetical protein
MLKINVKGIEIAIDYSKGIEETMLITANGKYIHNLELIIQEDYILFTWTCRQHKETVININNGQHIDKNLASFNDFLADYFTITKENSLDADCVMNSHRVALKEIIVIMEQVFMLITKDLCKKEEQFMLELKDDTAKNSLLEAIRMYQHWLSEANMSADEEEETEGYADSLEDIEKQLTHD